MAVADGRGVLVFKEMGLVSQVFDEPTLATLQGHLAIGHTRYSTTGGSHRERPAGVQDQRRRGRDRPAQRQPHQHCRPGRVARDRRAGRASHGGERRPSSDTDVMAELLAREADLSLEEAIVRTMPRLQGAASLVIMDEVRDRHRVRPLCAGPLPGAWVIASETAAQDIVGAAALAVEAPVEADLVIPVPGTAWFAGSYPIPIPDAAVLDLTPSAGTQPSTLPLPNP